MLRLVTTNNVEVFRHLGSVAFKRLNVTHTVAASYEEALEAIRSEKPKIAVLDVELAGGSGYALCKAVKDDDDLRGTHVILLLTSVITRAELDLIDNSRCDDVLALPMHTDDFYHHLAQIAGLPFRRNRRVGVELEVVLPNADGAVEGSVLNVSAEGIGVHVPASLADDELITVRLRHDGEAFPDASANVVWTKPGANEGETLAGLSFTADLPIETRILLEQLSLYDVSQAAEVSPMAGGVTVSLQGDFTEITDFSALAKRLEPETLIDFNAAAVRYISSAGVRAWCQFLGTLEGKTYSFRHCSIAFASQAAMVPMVIGTGAVHSLEAPYLCEECDREELRLLETKALVREDTHIFPPQLACTVCNGELEFDDVPDRYFAFLREDR
jgi:CheY-like chemotaxis protein